MEYTISIGLILLCGYLYYKYKKINDTNEELDIIYEMLTNLSLNIIKLEKKLNDQHLSLTRLESKIYEDSK